MNLPIVGLLALLAAAGCAPLEKAPAPEVRAGTPQEKAAAAKPPETPPAEATVAAAEAAAPRTAAVDAVPTSPEKSATPTATVEAPEVKAPAKAPAEPAPKKETPKPPAAPPLDLNTLEKRLKDTEAIGVFTKLTLKNQVDDLLERFEAHHGGANRISLAELRQPYDLLIIKVLSLLQDRDTRLANDLLQSREAIWNILSDPAKFQRLVNENRS
jgi:hypothetical protein